LFGVTFWLIVESSAEYPRRRRRAVVLRLARMKALDIISIRKNPFAK